MPSPLPPRDGVGATRLRIPREGQWPTVADYLLDRFGHIAPERLLARFERGEIVTRDGTPARADDPLGAYEFVWYYRSPPNEPEIPFMEEILYVDDDLVVVDKPHFLPTTPGGRFLQSSALIRLRNRLNNPDLVPIHRLDRATAGLLMFSARPSTRGAYQRLFEQRAVQKTYEAVSARPDTSGGSETIEVSSFPITYRNHIEKRRDRITVCIDTVPEPNSETLIELLGTGVSRSGLQVVHTLLRPRTGKMHQLRVHLAALDLGILHDRFYPELLADEPDDFNRPLQLLARELEFVDPLTGGMRHFVSERTLQEAPR